MITKVASYGQTAAAREAIAPEPAALLRLAANPET
jgi:hypothetical protein